MDAKAKERGILKLEPRPRVIVDSYRYELTPQGSSELPPSSPQPSVDRLSVTWADPSSMASSGVNLFHLPSETPVTNEVKFSPAAGDGSEDEDYSASLSAVLRQRRASVRRSRKGRARRPSSPFLPDENRPRRRSSVFTTSSGDTAISIEEAPAIVTQEQIFENIHLHKEVLGSVKQQPLGMRRKLKIVHQAKGYIKRHEGQLQERLAQSKSTRDIYARFNILIAAKWQQMKREAANTSNLLIPWELRIKEIESHFGSVVASYFTFLRWLFWVNLVIGFILLVFVIVPECLTANPEQDGGRKLIMKEELPNATNLLTLWEFEGVLKFSPIFYGFYSNIERVQYRMPLAYFLTGLVVYIYSFVAILRKMAENSRMSKLSEKEDECIFSWKLFTGWDFMIGNAETAHNRIASVVLGFKEALLEEAEKKKDLRNWRIISLRALVNICVAVLLVLSAYAVVTVVSRSDDNPKTRNWWRENETTIVVTVISITFPVFFELLGFLEHYHPRKQLRLQLARIMLLNLLNLYSLIFALFSKIDGMSKELDCLKPTLNMNVTNISNNTLNISESLIQLPTMCIEVVVPCGPCTHQVSLLAIENSSKTNKNKTSQKILTRSKNVTAPKVMQLQSYNLVAKTVNNNEESVESTTIDTALAIKNEILRLRMVAKENNITVDDVTKYPEQNDSYEESVESTTIDTALAIKNEILRLRMVAKENNITVDDVTKYPEQNDSYEESVESTTIDTALAIKNEMLRLRMVAKENNITFENVTDIPEQNDSYSYNDYYNNYDDLDDTVTESNKEASTITTTDIDDYTYSTETGSSFKTTDYSSLGTEMTELSTLDTTFIEKMSTGEDDLSTESPNRDVETTVTDFSNDDNITNVNPTLETTFDTGTTYINLMTPDIETNQPNLISNNKIMTTDFTTVETDISDTNQNKVPSISTSVNVSIHKTSISDVATTSVYDYTDDFTIPLLTKVIKSCPVLSFNCSVTCGKRNVTQVYTISNCTVIESVCYETKCIVYFEPRITDTNQTNKDESNETTIDIAYVDSYNIIQYNLTYQTRKKLLKLCWETMFGQELVKLTMMDLVFVLLGTLFLDFFRALFVRYMNRCWCWDLEKKCPEYGDFKIAENILHLINNQGMVWMGMFFSPGLVVLNVVKLMIMMYLRSWAVMTCNVPHEVVFRVSKSNNFYLGLLLTMLFLCVLPVGYTIVWVKPSWHCGPFSEYERIYYILRDNIYKLLPPSVNFALQYIASPAIVIPLLVLLVLIIYYLTSLTNSLREANNDLKIQLRRERTEERRKMFQLADNRIRAGSSAMDNTPFARWKKALPTLPLSKSIDSDDRKTCDENVAPLKITNKKKGGIFAKIVNMALDKKTDVSVTSDLPSPYSYNIDDETDTDFHESLPKEILKAKDIIILKNLDQKKKNSVEFKTDDKEKEKTKIDRSLIAKLEGIDDGTEKKSEVEKPNKHVSEINVNKSKSFKVDEKRNDSSESRKINEKQTSESSTQSRQSDSIGSVIPVIMISTTESDEEVLQFDRGRKDTRTKEKKHKEYVRGCRAHNDDFEKKNSRGSSDTKSLRRQSSVDSIKEEKATKVVTSEEGHKYQYSL